MWLGDARVTLAFGSHPNLEVDANHVAGIENDDNGDDNGE